MPKKTGKQGAVSWLQDSIDRLASVLGTVLEGECKKELEGVQPEILVGIRRAALNKMLLGLDYLSCPGKGSREDDIRASQPGGADASSGTHRRKGTRRGRRRQQEGAIPEVAESDSPQDPNGGEEAPEVRIPGLTME